TGGGEAVPRLLPPRPAYDPHPSGQLGSLPCPPARLGLGPEARFAHFRDHSCRGTGAPHGGRQGALAAGRAPAAGPCPRPAWAAGGGAGDLCQRSEEHTSELQSRENLVCRLLLEKKNKQE